MGNSQFVSLIKYEESISLCDKIICTCLHNHNHVHCTTCIFYTLCDARTRHPLR